MELIRIFFLVMVFLLLFCIFFNTNNKEHFKNEDSKYKCCKELGFLKAQIAGEKEYNSESIAKLTKNNNQNKIKIGDLEKKISNYENILEKINSKMVKTSTNLLGIQKDLLEKANYTTNTIKKIKSAGDKLKSKGNINTNKMENKNIKY